MHSPFKIGDKVRCVSGNHKGCEGVVVRLEGLSGDPRMTRFEFNKLGRTRTRGVWHHRLELIKPRGHHLTNIFK